MRQIEMRQIETILKQIETILKQIETFLRHETNINDLFFTNYRFFNLS